MNERCVLLVTGSRSLAREEGFNEYAVGRFESVVAQLDAEFGEIGEVVHGGAGGVDRAADAFFRARVAQVTVHKPDYARYGRIAPLLRNSAMAARCTHCLAIWDGESRGTLHQVRAALEFVSRERVTFFYFPWSTPGPIPWLGDPKPPRGLRGVAR